jgi:V8-like Glu-specific endopeptidase
MRIRGTNWSAYASVLGLTGGCLALITACSDQAPPSVVGEDLGETSEGVIIGTNDLVSVTAGGANVPAKYRPHIDGIGRLAKTAAATKGFCSATHLGNGIAVSAGHCWGAGTGRQNNVSCTSGSTCAGNAVQWGTTSGGSSSVSNITRILAMQVSTSGGRLDYAFFEVSPIPPTSIRVDWSGKAPVGRTLTIFSHPGGRTMEWSTTCPLAKAASTQITYNCDTEGGSSGASVLDDASLTVQGIHWGGATSGNSATYILDTPVREFLQPDGGGTGGTGGADGGDAGKADADGGKGGADGGDAAMDAPTDGSDASGEGGGAAGASGAAGAAGSAGASGASGAGGTAGSAGAAGAAGKAGSSGASGAGGSGGMAGKGGGAGTGGATGGGAGTGGAGGATGGSGGSAGTTGGAAGTTGGKGGTGGSTGGSGGTGTSDDGGCSCRIGASSSASEGGDHLRGLLAAFAVGLVSLRRARRKRSPTPS